MDLAAYSLQQFLCMKEKEEKVFAKVVMDQG